MLVSRLYDLAAVYYQSSIYASTNYKCNLMLPTHVQYIWICPLGMTYDIEQVYPLLVLHFCCLNNIVI